MNFIKENKLLIKNIIIAVIMVSIIIGLTFYSNQLYNQLEKVTTEKELVEIEINKVIEDLELVRNELDIAHKEIEKYKKEVEDDDAKWKRRYEEFPIATDVWISMKTYGWSDIVCAGIMGNLMAETGGSGTLHLDWDSNGESGFGLVQWIGSRRSAIKSKYGEYPSVKEQVQFIYDELYGANGVSCQVTDGQFNAIMNAETPEECAYAFACYYERCAVEVRSMRKNFARKAYNYFVDDKV